MCKLDLQPSFRGRRPLTENLEDQAGTVDDLGIGAVLEVLLLDRRDCAVDDQQLRVAIADRLTDPVDLARAEQGRRARLADAEMQTLFDLDADRLGKAGGFVEPRADVADAVLAGVGQGNDRARAARDVSIGLAVENAQARGSSACASIRLTGCSGCTVEMACL